MAIKIRKTLPTRTWPLFVVGFGSLLALLFLPGIVALHRTRAVYLDIRLIQESHQQTQRLLSEIERELYLTSITVREVLLDSSPVNTSRYKAAFDTARRQTDQELAILKQKSFVEGRDALAKLDQELQPYFTAIEPVFEWSPRERSARGMYFLREQQRPRRQAIIAIAEEISRLSEASYARQFDEVNRSQTKFSSDIERIIGVAFIIGLTIAAVTIVRISNLEKHSELQRTKAEQAEEQLRSLSTKLMSAQEEERKTISRELHDEVGQVLTGLRIGLGSLERLRTNPDEFQVHLTEAKSLNEQALRAARDLAVGLRPSVLDLGLVPAVEWLARQVSKYSGTPVNVTRVGNLDTVPERYRTCIYRVVQECLTNAVKHAGATSMRVELKEVNRNLEVRVQDDGRGFVPHEGGGMGLIGIEERVRELGGIFTVESRPGAGSSVRVELQLPVAS